MYMLRVKELCKEKHLTQKELSERIGIAEISLSRSINGNPTLETLEKIAAALGVEVSELFAPKSNTIVCPKCGTVLDVTERKRGDGRDEREQARGKDLQEGL